MPSPTQSACACATCRCRRRGCAPQSTRRSLYGGRPNRCVPRHCEAPSGAAAISIGQCSETARLLRCDRNDGGTLTMPRVHFSGEAARRFTGGATELEVEANNFRRMVLELDRRFPGLGRQIEESMAVAIDGEIYQDAYLAPLNPDSEIVLIPKIGGG